MAMLFTTVSVTYPGPAAATSWAAHVLFVAAAVLMAAAENDEYDEDWRTERLHLLVHSTAETERRTLPANIAGTLLVIGAAQSLPNATDFHIPMLLRFVALFATALLYRTIRQRLDAKASTLVPMRMASGVAAFGGGEGCHLATPGRAGAGCAG